MGHRILHCFFSVFANIDRLCGLSQNESCFFSKNLDFFPNCQYFRFVRLFLLTFVTMRIWEKHRKRQPRNWSPPAKGNRMSCGYADNTNRRKRPPPVGGSPTRSRAERNNVGRTLGNPRRLEPALRGRTIMRGTPCCKAWNYRDSLFKSTDVFP